MLFLSLAWNLTSLSKFLELFILNIRIDRFNGLITVEKELDREKQSVFIVNIFVMDSGTPPLNSSTTLEIILEDGKIHFLNIFIKMFYSFLIKSAHLD